MPTVPLLAFGITHLTDARYFAAWEARYLCFPIGTDGISPDYFHAIREWVEGPVCVPQLGGAAGENLLVELKADAVMVDYGNVIPSSAVLPTTLITRLPVAGYQSVLDLREQLNELTGPVVLDFTAGGITWSDLVEGHPFSTGLLHELIDDREVYVRIDLTPDEAAAAAEVVPGLAFMGSSEEKVGYKSFDDIDDLLYAL